MGAELIAEDDLVASRTRVTGTHRAELHGIAATGRSLDYEDCDVLRFDEAGRILETWNYADNLTVMQQLGAMTEDPQPA
jgi:predicted ester cyclase